MDLELTDEQTWLAESVDALLDRPRDPAALWPELVAFGVLSIATGADDLGAIELALVGRGLGRRLAVTPFVDSAAARYALRPQGGHPAAADLLSGDDAVAVALLEPGGGWTLPGGATACVDGAVSGRKCAVEHATEAERVLVLCGGPDDRALALVSRAADGVGATPQPSPDPAIALHELTFADVAADAPPLAADDAERALARLMAVGGVLAAAEAAGAAEQLLTLAVDYAAQRRQFGRSIGSFQALRHLLADMYVKQSAAWSSVLFAAAALDDGDDGAHRTASVAKAYTSRATLDVAHGALQVFGGIAFTDEHPAHRFLRRILVRGRQFGDAAHHERELGRALAGEPAPATT